MRQRLLNVRTSCLQDVDSGIVESTNFVGRHCAAFLTSDWSTLRCAQDR